jgi:cytoskeletal protein CcmA (bactofilin family)
MSMFKNKPGTETNQSATAGNTLIGYGTNINGDVIITGDLRIDGTLIGSIKGNAKVVIGVTGVVMGDIDCTNADIQGKVHGTLHVSDMLNLRGEAIIEGDIFSGKLQIEPRVTFNGHCHMGKDQKVVEMNTDEIRKTVGIR